MADPRTFVLIGDFQDNITPALESINNAINSFKRNMASMATKRGGGYNDVTQSVGKLVSAQKHLKEAIEGVGAAAKSATQDLKDYKSVMGKVASAQYHVQRSGTAAGKAQSKFWEGANNDLNAYRRNMEALQRQTRINPYRALTPPREARRGGGRGGVTPMMMAPGGGGPPRNGGGGGMGRSRHGMGDGLGEYMGTFAFGMELGQGLAQPITTAIFSGFQMGVGLMAKTMELVQSSFAERVQDQMTDLQAAGGFYSISQRQKNPMFASLQTAIQFTQENNLLMARMASDLPGATKDYVEVSKRLGDSIMRMADSNEKGAIEYARELMAKGGLQETYKGVELEGANAREGAIQVILGELTKKTVLAGFGGSTGRGGATGAYGLPAQMEKLITNPDTSLAQLQRYAAVFGDPKIMNALERAMPELEKAGGNMLERAKIVNKMLDEIVPPEMIAAMRKSMAGIGEAYRSAFFDPETGLFGFGRKIGEATEPMTNAFGQFVRIVEKNGKKIEEVVASAELADKVQLSIFEMFADLVSNYGAILKPIVDSLYLLWDPMVGLKDVLADARIISTQILGAFREYNEALTEYANTIKDEGERNKYLSTRGLRASLLTINEIFNDLGVIGDSDFQAIAKQITDPKAGVKDLGKILSSTLDTFFKSDAAYNVGKFVGEMLRAVVDSLSDMTGFFANLGKTQLASGFMAGFGKDGVKKLQKLFTDIYQLLFDAALAILPKIPWQIYAAAAAGLVIPAAVAALGMAIGGGIAEMLKRMGENALKALSKVKSGKGAEAVTEVVEEAAKARANYGGIPYSPYAPPEAPKTPPPKPTLKGRLKNFLKGTVGAGDEFKSVFGDRFVKGAKGAKDLVKGDASVRAFAKGLPVKIVSVAKNAATAAKGGAAAVKAGGLGAILGGLKGAGGGLKGLFSKGMTGLGKFGGIATAGVGIVEAIMALLSGDSLGQALGKGAGPVIGTIIGTALLGPIGGMIGSWIGSMESITGPLGSAFESIMGTLNTLGGLLVQVGGDISGIIASMFGLGKEFSLLEYLINAVLSPFRLLEIAIIGIYEMYLRLKPFKSREEQEKLDELYLLRMQKTASEEIKWRAGMNQKFLEERKKELEGLKAEGKGNTDRARQLGFMIEEITKNLKDKVDKKRKVGEKSTLNGREVTWTGSEWKPTGKPGAPGAPKPSAPAQSTGKPIYSTPGKPGFLTLDGKTFWRGTDGTLTAVVGGVAPKPPTTKPVGGSPSGTSTPAKSSLLGDLPKTSEQNAKNTTDLNKKATDQIKKVAEVKTSTDRTTQAVNNLTAKITAQTNLQTTTAAIYNLLASGTLRVLTNIKVPNQNPNQTKPSTTPKTQPTRVPVPNTQSPIDRPPGQRNQTPSVNTPGGMAIGVAEGSPGKTFSNLAAAAAYENKHKPAGSKLGVFNTSETVIPAAGGYGMVDFVDTLKWGFASMLGAFKQAQQKQDALLGNINQTLKINQQQTNARLMAMEKKFNTPGMAGGLGGAAAGGVDAFTPIAQKYGLQMTSGYRPGDPGWHGANRARDFSNGTGPTPQMMQFAQYLASTYGSNLKELIYTPLGFSIKNGQRVPPYAQGSHYNHVHVAYANGIGNPIVTPTGDMARKIDEQALGKANVKTYTAGKGEFGGGDNITINAPITISGVDRDADELASIVALKIGEAVADARSASIFV